jgi:hypothetical protein
MPWQLTVGKLRKTLEGVPDDVVVALMLPPGSLGDATLTTFHNLRPDYADGAVFKLVVGPPAGPSSDVLADVAATHIDAVARQPLSRPRIAAQLYERLYGGRRYWECCKQGIITPSELRTVLLGDVQDTIARDYPSYADIDEPTWKALGLAFDEVLATELTKD